MKSCEGSNPSLSVLCSLGGILADTLDLGSSAEMCKGSSPLESILFIRFILSAKGLML